MKIPNIHRLVMKDIYSYDISACHYNILKKHGFNVDQLDKDDKMGRNIAIGKMMKENPRISSLLRHTTTSLINEYIHINKLQDGDIILNQYDGIITTKILRETNLNNMPIEYRHHFEVFITSINRRMYIAKASNYDLVIKGVSNRYPQIDKFYERICKINFAHKGTIFKTLYKIKRDFLESHDSSLFGIPTKNNKVNVILKGYGEIEIAASMLRIMDAQDIDRDRYFKFYIEPFTKSIVAEFVR